MRTTTVGLCAIVAGITALVAFTAAAPAQEVTYERLLNADKEPHNWLTYYGNYKGWRYSSLSQINTTNVKRLVVKWAFQTGPDQNFQVTPLVVDGVMYLTNEKNHVFALDAATGKLLWRYTHELPDPGKMPFRIWGFGINRGVSLAKGKVLVGTWDAHLLALDAKTGKHGLLEALDVKTGEIRWHYRSKYPMPASVLTTAGGLVFTGDQEGNALAFDASNGELLWTFNTGSGLRGSPISYAVGGKQYIAVPSGRGGFLAWHQPAFPELANATQGSTLFVFGLFEE